MIHEKTFRVLDPASLRTLAVGTTVALVAGIALALGGLPILFVVLALATLAVFAAVAAKLPMAALSVAVFFLALSPFNFGIQTGVVPKLFGDEALLLLYLAAFPVLYLMTSRRWQVGFGWLYAALLAFMLTEAAPFIAFGKDLIASRNLIETCFLGILLCVLALQEASNADGEEMVLSSVILTTLLIAALSVTERIVQRNPIMEHVTDFVYLSPEIVKITEGVYRPYTTFFHPSEAGTFMALGAPFLLYRWLQRRTFASLAGLLVLAAGLLVNATRGVWFGLAITAILLVPNALRAVTAVTPVFAVAGTVIYAVFKNTPFMQRLTDPNNLLSRLEFWKIALLAFADHPLFGVGHMQFPKIYLNYVQDLSNEAHFDITSVSVADNMYLTTLAEHGIAGLLAQIGLLVFLVRTLARFYKRLKAEGLFRQASLIRSCQAAVLIYAGTGCFADINQFTKVTKYLFILVGFGLGNAARYPGRRTPRMRRTPKTRERGGCSMSNVGSHNERPSTGLEHVETAVPGTPGTGVDISIIYVDWNCSGEILESIASVREWSQTLRYEVIVVDNASPQGPGELGNDRGLRLVRSTENKGFGAGCNLGARAASGRYLLFLNPDTRFRNDVLSELFNFIEGHKTAAVVGPMVEDAAGNVLFDGARSLPTLFYEFLQHSTLAFKFPHASWASGPYLSTWDHRSTREVETVLGACMLVRSELFRDIGGFDEAFFLYSEELDLCHRFRLAGYQVWYVHTARLLHKERQSTIQLFGSVGKIVLQNMRSQHYYFQKHYGKRAAFMWRKMIAGLYLLRYLTGRDKVHLEYFKWAIAG